ncbi:MAG: PIG-L family deacetylase [Ardenticatenia bacterium]|nr:MAG: PIG-L family deacetylase [Ardenticatenia bacterium]
MPTRLFLSPHLDDAILSCGGLIAQAHAAGDRLIIATIFAGDPSPLAAQLPFARYQHTLWGDPIAPMPLRRAEDLAAAAALGVHDVVHLTFADAVYRHLPTGEALYTNDDDLFGALHSADEPLINAIANALHPLIAEADDIYAPLGLGNHVDHQLVAHAARRLSTAARLVWYEELPYAEWDDPTAHTATRTKHPHLVAIDETAMMRKLDAMGYYRTQIPVLYRNEIAMHRRVRAYAARLAAGLSAPYAERYWLEGVPT